MKILFSYFWEFSGNFIYVYKYFFYIVFYGDFFLRICFLGVLCDIVIGINNSIFIIVYIVVVVLVWYGFFFGN